MNVLQAAKKRVALAFDDFDKICVSFSGGKDSTILVHLVAAEAKSRDRKFGLLFLDLEAQYSNTITHVRKIFDLYAEIIDPLWVTAPLSLRNATSVFEPKWVCWEPGNDWVREKPKGAVDDFPFFKYGMEFEEFVIKFAEWYAGTQSLASFVGIRIDESLNRHRAIFSNKKGSYRDNVFTTVKSETVVNFYPIYDWKAGDIWKFHHDTKLPFNQIYEKMYKAQVPTHQMRICQPYGDEQKRGLYLYHILEPKTWTKIIKRVSGANSGALYSQQTGNVNGYRRITKPKDRSWQEFANLLLTSTPEPSKSQYESVILRFLTKWAKRGYPNGIPEEAHINLETHDRAPSWRRVCWMLLRNDFYGKGLGFNAIERKDYEHTIS